MTADVHQRYDFAAAARVALPLRQKLNAWSRKSAELFNEQWAGVSATAISTRSANVDAKSFSQVQESWTEPSCGVPIGFRDGALNGILVAENRQIRLLLMDILGGDVEDITDKDLTSVEVSLAEMVFELVAVSFSEGWFEQDPLPFKLGRFEDQPNRSRQFAADRELLICGLQVEFSEQLANLQLVLAKDESVQVLRVEAADSTVSASGKRIPEHQIALIEVNLQAQLGTAMVNMPDLVSLAPGDVVVLHQTIDQPVQVTANGQPLCTAWPGKRLHQQVLRVETLD